MKLGMLDKADIKVHKPTRGNIYRDQAHPDMSRLDLPPAPSFIFRHLFVERVCP